MENIGESASFVMHNARVLRYPDGTLDVLCASRHVFHNEGWELSAGGRRRGLPKAAIPSEEDLEEAAYAAAEREGKALNDGREPQPDRTNRRRSIRRARARVRMLALANGFTHFVTLTVSPDTVDRHDDKAVLRKALHWLNNAVQRRGLRYVLVPERHKDGALHFHGLVAGLPLTDSGTISRPGDKKPRRPRSRAQREAWLAEGGHVVYNVDDWRMGFSTAIPLYGDYSAAVAYVCKYIGKAQEGAGEKIGGRWYYSGGALAEPERLLFDADMEAIADSYPGGHSFTIPEAGLEYYMVTIPGGRR